MSHSKDDRYMIQVNEQPAFECPKDKTVLEAMESNDLEVHFHCREGFCGACRTKLLDGEVDYTTDPLAFIDDDEILPCCCVPKSAIKLKQV